MKQYHVETKNQATGEWNLYERFKCRYALGYVTKAWHWPLDCRPFSKFVVVNEADAELEAACNAITLANHVNRRRRLPGTNVVAFIETRIVEVEFVLRLGCHGRLRRLVWQNGEFGQKARTNGAHTA